MANLHALDNHRQNFTKKHFCPLIRNKNYKIPIKKLDWDICKEQKKLYKMFDWVYRKLFNLLTMFTLKTHVIEIKSSSIIKTNKTYFHEKQN
ncbi:hypothetical protein BpHYR1_029578 [Brachionus plicatilis]|uniref:Uncharacterized protein n=1 Tax=Brachionus plicatilis TaxID=10195 RepID=A0A3M7S535_BRAPC|nr:hypothetical protein BpHYR1_029578 [Brachionus plicatilis]